MLFRKIIAFVSLLFVFTSCAKKHKKAHHTELRVGFVYMGSIDDEGYNQAQERARIALDKLNIETVYVENVPADMRCVETLKSLIGLGCKIIYVTSESFVEYVFDIAGKYPDVSFLVCSSSRTSHNVASYFGRMYEVRYLSGIVAGLKTSTNKIGYVAAFKNTECIRGLNAFTLGVQSVNPNAVVEVKFTGAYENYEKESHFAELLIDSGCDVITQHQVSNACLDKAAERNVFCIGYNNAFSDRYPDSYLTSCVFNWGKFSVKDIERYRHGKWEGKKYWEGLESDVVELSPLSKICTPGTERIVEDAEFRIENKMLNVFQGPLYDSEGKLMVKEGTSLSDDEIWNMNWTVRGIIEDKSF